MPVLSVGLIVKRFASKPLSVLTVEGPDGTADIVSAKMVEGSYGTVARISFNYRTGSMSHIRSLDVPTFALFIEVRRG
jgi:hypothetical protein